VWDPYTQQWEEGFAALKKFKEREGHCSVRKDHKEDRYTLGNWVNNQRSKKNTLTPEQIRRLNELGFVWDQLTQQWEEGFAALTRFKEREGHCLVRHESRHDGFRLGDWVKKQRSRKNTLTPERIRRLDELGFVWTVRKTPTKGPKT
jgi:hypothetical protein